MSLKNMRYIAWPRALVCVMLALSSLPLHLLYNSVIFSSTSVNDFSALVVSETFTQGGRYNPNNILSSSNPADGYVYDATFDERVTRSLWNSSASLQRFDPRDCVDVYSQSYVSANRNFLLVTDPLPSPDETLLAAGFNHNATWAAPDEHQVRSSCDFTKPGTYGNYSQLGWLCSGANVQCGNFDGVHDRGESICNLTGSNTTWLVYAQDRNVPVRYCLAEKTVPRCQLSMSSTILIVVIVCNFAKLVAFAFLLINRTSPLITVGDAIASFLDSNDLCSQNMPLLSYPEVLTRYWASEKAFTGTERQRQPTIIHRPQENKRWFQAVSRFRLYTTLFSWLAICVVTFTLLFSSLKSRSVTFKDFGEINQDYLWRSDKAGGIPLIAVSIIANLPQLLISMAYVAFTGWLTAMLVSVEVSRFLTERNGLRVSIPQGAQRSTRWLSVPFKYSVPFAIMMVILHWTMAESIFLVKLDYFDIYGTPKTEGSGSAYIQTFGWSPAATLISLIVVVLLIIVSLYLTGKKFPLGAPIISTSSIAISAACHPSILDPTRLAERPLRYGLLSDANETEDIRIGFSADDVLPLPIYKVMTRPGRRALDKLKDAPYLATEADEPMSASMEAKTGVAVLDIRNGVDEGALRSS